jgi:hypothetical protein
VKHELSRLRTLLGKLGTGPRILVTHYPVCLADGSPETKIHGLANLPEVVDVARGGGTSLWLHGHRHHVYYLAHPPQAPFPVICAGSVTQEGNWAYLEYTIEGNRLRAARREFISADAGFIEKDGFELTLDG